MRPRLWRTQCGHQEIAESCPELQREFPEPPLRGFGVVGKIAAGDEVLRSLRLDPSKGIEEASIRGMLEEPSREMWDHDGLCVRGKRTYLFSRCPSCSFVGDLHREQCVVLELLTQHLVITKWDHLASKVRVKVDPKSFAYPMEVSADELRREQLAILARDAAGVSEFRVTGSIRTAWYEAQRRDPSLTTALKKPEAPMVLAADGLLERSRR